MAKRYIILILLALIGSLNFVNFALAESCPSNTTVEGTTVIFVGEATDMGGDSTVGAWFEYGQSANYSQKTLEKTLTQEGRYCITVSNLNPCATYHYRAAIRNSIYTSYGEDKTFTTTCGPTVDIKANGSNGPITVSYGSSVALTWNSTNANSCSASGNWSGTKPTSGSESTGNLIFSRSYTLTCSGPGGSTSDSVTVNVGSAPAPAAISVSKLVKNVSRGQSSWYESIYANPSENLSFNILVASIGNTKTDNIFVKDILPSKIIYSGNLKVDGVSFGGNIISGINIGALEPGKLKVITFDASIASKDNFSYGQTNLENKVEITAGNILKTDTASVYVNKTAVAGAATEISTGIASTLFSSLLPPFLIALALIFLFQTNFFKMESWIEGRMKEKRGYMAEKQLEKYRKFYTEKR